MEPKERGRWIRSPHPRHSEGGFDGRRSAEPAAGNTGDQQWSLGKVLHVAYVLSTVHRMSRGGRSRQSTSVRWVSLGGTLQSSGHDPLDFDRYFMTGREVALEQLLADIGESPDSVVVDPLPPRPSHDLLPTDVLELAEYLHSCPEEATVVTCGSNGIEELAYLLWLVLPRSAPVILTAAMRPPTAVGTDALHNLAAAFTVARAERLRGHSVLLVSNGVILHPTQALKMHTYSIAAFTDSAPPYGTVCPGGVVAIYRAPLISPWGGRAIPQKLARVDVVTSVMGSDGASISGAVESGARGIVSAGTGAGFPTSAEKAELMRAVDAGVVVCRSRRTPLGEVAEGEPRWLSSGALTPQKARLALGLGLEVRASLPEIQELLLHTP